MSRNVTPASKSNPAAISGSNRRRKSEKYACRTCFISWSYDVLGMGRVSLARDDLWQSRRSLTCLPYYAQADGVDVVMRRQALAYAE